MVEINSKESLISVIFSLFFGRNYAYQCGNVLLAARVVAALFSVPFRIQVLVTNLTVRPVNLCRFIVLVHHRCTGCAQDVYGV